MKTKKIKSSAKDGQEKRDRKIIKLFFSMLEEKGMTLEEFNAPRKKNKRGSVERMMRQIADKAPKTMEERKEEAQEMAMLTAKAKDTDNA